MAVADQHLGLHARQGDVVDFFVGRVDAAVAGVAAQMDLRLGIEGAGGNAHAIEGRRLLGLGHAGACRASRMAPFRAMTSVV
ncbi:hypothetical protein DIR46_25135 [Massilia oculi]|uniref:Uncharacterized protein n=1 Tax=Massilia oculi TaxID=945844 RepID=A0A2S2DQ07_9BURK|nr:hypothetical protein [Massilia oculi]AWL07388.1 hypothetical protein DIR46_25135 [Massilia oculi]